jgi:hypothetical protein
MAWTTPRTYVALEIITHIVLNTDLRDNMMVLSTHVHDGSAGQGDDELTGIDFITFDDLMADPAVTRRMQANGVNLKWYNGTQVVSFTEADAAAATPSPRTLGSGALQAAGGTHGHTLANYAQGVSNTDLLAPSGNNIHTGANINRGDNYDIATTTTSTLISQNMTKKVAAFMQYILHMRATGNGSAKAFIEVNGVEQVSFTSASGTQRGNVYLLALGVQTINIVFVVKLQNNSTNVACHFCVGEATDVAGTEATTAAATGTSTGRTAIGDLGAA